MLKDIASVQTTKYILDKYHLNALKKYGQNFLVDVNIINKIIKEADIDKDTLVVEVGVGLGSLTQQLVKHAGLVIAYEIDERFKDVHQEFLTADNLTINYQDYLTVDIKEVLANKNYSKCIMVSNVPYYITSDIIEHTITSNSKISKMYLMVQKEVALKFNQDTKMPLNLLIEDMGSSEYLFTVSKKVFIPAPHVDSAILKISIDRLYNEKLYKLLKDSFKQKRKTLNNNLKDYHRINEILNECQIDGTKRPHQLTIQDYNKILEKL